MSENTSERVAYYRKLYAKHDRAALVEKVQTRVPYCDEHIAAKQLLDEMDARTREEAEERRHGEIQHRLDDLKRPHWTVLPNFWVSAAALLAAGLSAYFAWLAIRSVAPSAPVSASPTPQQVPGLAPPPQSASPAPVASPPPAASAADTSPTQASSP